MTLFVNHQDKLDHWEKMLKILRHLLVGKSKTRSDGQILSSGIRTLDTYLNDEEVEVVPPKKLFQSKSARQRRRRNVMKRIYGSSYDHDADDYR